jgi:transcription termination factor Rho
MAVLDRSELEASPLADLHAIADQLGLEGFRRMRKAELIDAILGGSSSRPDDASEAADASAEEDAQAPDSEPAGAAARGARRRRIGRPRRPRGEAAADEGSGRKAARAESTRAGDADDARVADGVVELLGNGSAFLRVDPPEASDQDVYISAAQVRRCELVSGDQVAGPVRTPRRSERYPSLVRIDTINGVPAGEASEGARYEERPVAYPSERFALDGGDATLDAVQWLTPFGRGSRVLIIGPPRSGKTELLRRIFAAIAGSADLEVTLVLAGVRPEEIADWSEGSVAPAVALSFAASADAQGQAVERAIDVAKRTAARGADALVLIDTLDGLHPHAARKALAAARNLRDGGSLTMLATATHAIGGETTVIALDRGLLGTGGPPLDLAASGTVRAELLVGDEGASAIAEARAAALAHARAD